MSILRLIPPVVNSPPNHLTIVLGKGLITNIMINFPIMPESFMGLKKYLVTITNTLAGGFVDDFGPAPSPFTIKGTFGYNTKASVLGATYTGFGWAKYLEWLVDLSHEPDKEGKFFEVWMLSFASQHFYRVILEDFNITQDISRNNLWVYTLRLTALHPIVGNIAKGVIDLALMNINETIANRIKMEGSKILDTTRLGL